MQLYRKMCPKRQGVIVLPVGFVGLTWLLNAKKKPCDYYLTDEHPLSKVLEDL
jgi:hypothetical protein